MRLSVEGQLLIVEGTGPANIEMVHEYQRQVMGLRKQIMHAPWASLALLSGTPLVSPEAKDQFVQVIKQAGAMHLRATAVVLIDMESAEMVRQFWQGIYIEAGVNYKFFETQQEARIWLHAILKDDTK
jgi:hypothetical protein